MARQLKIAEPEADPAGEQAAIVKALTRIAESWKLTNEEAAALAGVNARTWSRMKGGTYAGQLNQDQEMRASLLVGLFKGLRLLFNGPLTYEWPKRPNQGFGGRRPVDLMMADGIPGMMRMRGHVDGLRGGA